MNKLLVLAKNRETYFINRLISEVGYSGLEFLNPWELSLEQLQNKHIGPVLVRTSGVYGDNKDLEVLEKEFSHNIVLNSRSSLLICRRKSSQFSLFNQKSIPILPWLHLSQSNWSDIENFILDQKGDFLIKPDRGQGGRGIQKFSKFEFKNWLECSTDLDFILQPFVPDFFEYRIFFIRNSFRVTLRRFKVGNGLAANFTQEGSAEIVQTPKEINELLDLILEEIEIHYGAIDVIFFKGQFYVLEVNSVPGIEQIEKLSNQNIMRRILSSLN